MYVCKRVLVRTTPWEEISERVRIEKEISERVRIEKEISERVRIEKESG